MNNDNYVAYNDPGSCDDCNDDDEDFGYDMGADLARFYSFHRDGNDNAISGMMPQDFTNRDTDSTSFNDNPWPENGVTGGGGGGGGTNNPRPRDPRINITVPSRHGATTRRRRGGGGGSNSGSVSGRSSARRREEIVRRAATRAHMMARNEISRHDADPQQYAEMKDKEAKLASLFKFVGDDILDLKKMTGTGVNRDEDEDEDEERQIQQIIDNLPTLMKEFNQNKIDLPTLYKKMQSDINGIGNNGSSSSGGDGRQAHGNGNGNGNGNGTRGQPPCKICAITSLNPLAFSKMSAFMAMKMVEIEMIGNVNPDQLTRNKKNVFNMYQLGIFTQGGKFDTLITRADVRRHASCSNDILCIQNEIVTLLRGIMYKLSSQISGNIITPDGPLPYTNTTRIKVLMNVMNLLEKMTVNFLSTKRGMRNAMYTTGSVLDALTTVGHARSMAGAHSKNSGGAGDARFADDGNGNGNFGNAFGIGKGNNNDQAAFGAGGGGDGGKGNKHSGTGAGSRNCKDNPLMKSRLDHGRGVNKFGHHKEVS